MNRKKFLSSLIGLMMVLSFSILNSSSFAAEMSAGEAIAAAITNGEIVDLTVLIAENYPAHWPTHNQFQRWTFNWFQPIKGKYENNLAQSVFPYYGQRMIIDEHTGTQIDFPAHFIPPKGSGLPFEGEAGSLTGSNYPLERQMGPVDVIDVRSILDKAENGKSPAITVDMIKDWEKKNGEIKPGEVVAFYSSYSDKYYKPFPEGNRLAFDPLITKTAPGWPAPTPEVMEYLHSKGVWHVATDGPSMGPVEAGQPTHVAGLKYGMSWTELCTNLGKLPARGAYFISLHAKIVDGSGGIARAIAIKSKGVKGVGEQ
jgi:kynurenine formamidase